MQAAKFHTVLARCKRRDIMNRLVAVPGASLKTGNSCKSLVSSRVRRRSSVERLEAQWRELRRHATIVKDPEKMLRLTAEMEKRRSEAVGADAKPLQP